LLEQLRRYVARPTLVSAVIATAPANSCCSWISPGTTARLTW